jgi:ATP-binding cassette subfamily F protein uup
MEGEGRVGEYVGGYSDWLRQRPARRRKPGHAQAGARRRAQSRAGAAPAVAVPKRKLSFKDQRELEALPALIESLEANLRASPKR